jgi:transaldolase
MTLSVNDLKIKLFADGADLNGMLEMSAKPYIKGLTTNPTLMRKAGIVNYKEFAIEVLTQISDKPISFEVFSDDLQEMKRQALEIASWGENVTAIMTSKQVRVVAEALDPSIPSYISVFAGRIADTGRNPEPIMMEVLEILESFAKAELIWASPRELLNVFQANEIGCHIITATSDVLKKLDLVGKDLDAYSVDTVRMFRSDAEASRYEI